MLRERVDAEAQIDLQCTDLGIHLIRRGQIDSGQLAEPYWYLDSPLTTMADPEALAAFPVQPGLARPLLPGVLCPDSPLVDGGRLRWLFGPGFTVLANPGVEVDAAGFPVQTVSLDHLADDGQLADALGIAELGLALVRPDGYLAAVLGDPAELPAALRRAAGWVPA